MLMSKVIQLFLLLLPTLALAKTPSTSPLLRTEHAAIGTTLWLHLKDGPFPCEGKPYRDATTAIFVPAAYEPQNKSTCWCTFTATMAWCRARLSNTNCASKWRNRVAISCLSCRKARPMPHDSAGGKLELQDGFATFTHEIQQLLGRKDVRKALLPLNFPKQLHLGHVALSAHSGGYHVTAKVLELGGVPIHEVFLFDALYGDVPLFRDWLAQKQGQGKRLILWFTGGAPMQLGQICARACTRQACT